MAWGLGVSIVSIGPDRPVVMVKEGLALNRLGALVHLPGDAEVALVPETRAAAVTAGLFAECEPLRPDGALGGEGVYVLAIAPTSGYRGTAPVSDPNTTAAGRGACGARFRVEGVRFRLVRMAIAELAGISEKLRGHLLDLMKDGTATARARLRNGLAHLCFGTETLGGYFTDPLQHVASRPAWAGWGGLDAMRDRGDLTDCDVPLAVIVLAEHGISFVDVWAARRRLIDASAIDAWRAVAGPRRVAEGEAAFLQFQTQLEGIPGMASPPGVTASTYFDVLPAAGWLPGGAAGFDWRTFLGPHAPPEVTPVDAALLRGIIERSWFDEPFALDTAPPVPLRVYEVPEDSLGEAPKSPFVVFARSANGNVRVRLSPAPLDGEAVSAVAVAKTGATVRSTTRVGAMVPLVELGPGQHLVAVTAPDYVALEASEVTAIGGRTIDLDLKLTPLPNGTIVVSAIDRATGGSVNASVVSITATAVEGGEPRAGTPQPGTGKWVIADLPPATYILNGVARGYKAATAGPVGPTARGVQTPATLIFERSERPNERPPDCVRVEFVERPQLRNVRLCMVLSATEFEEAHYYGERVRKAAQGMVTETFRLAKRKQTAITREAARYAAPSGELVYARAPWERMVPLEPESGKVREWLVAWRGWLADELDDAGIRKATPVVYLDPRYQRPTAARLVPDKPPGYAVFLHFGVPLAIKFEDALTKLPVTVEQADLLGVARKTAFDLCTAAICNLDDLAWAWSELVADATGDPPDAGRYLIADAAGEVQAINEERRYYPGVDKGVDKALKELGIVDDVALANADPETLGAKLKSEGFAVRLIQQARRIVPASGWSLEGLGLAPMEVSGLANRGIDSQGILAGRATEEAGKADIVAALGLEAQPEPARDAAITALSGQALTSMAASSVALMPVREVSSLASVDAITASKLSAAGIVSVEELAAAEPAAVATATNLTAAAAGKLVSEAKRGSRAGQDVTIVAPVTRDEAKNLTTMFGAGKATLAAVAGKKPEALAEAFGGDVARAAAVVNGIKVGLAARGPG